jgi:glycosyltransferase involved in cell wall biosynthesis
LVPPGDTEALARAMSTIVESSDVRDRMGASGRSKVETTYRWEIIGAQLEETYEATLRRRQLATPEDTYAG